MSEDERTANRRAGARAICADIEKCIDAQRLRIYDEIRSYPTPIAGCDQQFNYLLERQAIVLAELVAVRTLAADCASHPHPIAAIADFIAASNCLDDQAKIRFRLASESLRLTWI